MNMLDGWRNIIVIALIYREGEWVNAPEELNRLIRTKSGNIDEGISILLGSSIEGENYVSMIGMNETKTIFDWIKRQGLEKVHFHYAQKNRLTDDVERGVLEYKKGRLFLSNHCVRWDHSSFSKHLNNKHPQDMTDGEFKKISKKVKTGFYGGHRDLFNSLIIDYREELFSRMSYLATHTLKENSKRYSGGEYVIETWRNKHLE